MPCGNSKVPLALCVTPLEPINLKHVTELTNPREPVKGDVYNTRVSKVAGRYRNKACQSSSALSKPQRGQGSAKLNGELVDEGLAERSLSLI